MKYYKVRLRKLPHHGDEDPRITTVDAVSETLRTITLDTGITVQRVHEHGSYYPTREQAAEALRKGQAARIAFLEERLERARGRLREIDEQGRR